MERSKKVQLKKGLDRVDSNLPPDIKNSLFIARNYKQILIFSAGSVAFSLFLTFLVYMNLTSVIEQQASTINNISRKVVFVRADGKVAQLEKEDISQNFLTYILRDIVINRVILSGFDIQKSKLSSVNDEELKSNGRISRLLPLFSEEGLSGYKAYLETVLSSYSNNNLPEVIWTSDLSGLKDKAVVDGKKFRYTALIPVEVVFVQNQVWQRSTANIDMQMEGEIDMANSSPENPFGIKITYFEVRNYVSKK